MKKALFVILLIISIHVNALGQKKWAIGLSSSLDLTGVFVNNSSYLEARTIGGIASYSAIIHIHRFVSPTTFIKSGIGIYASGYQETIDFDRLFQNSNTLFYVGQSRIQENQYSTKYLECPIVFGWQSKSTGKVHFYGTFGPSLRLFLFSNSFYKNGTNTSSSTYSIGHINDKYLFGLDGILSVGVSIDISSNTTLLIENSNRINIIPAIGTPYYGIDLFRQWGTGLKVGIMYYFGGSKK